MSHGFGAPFENRYAAGCELARHLEVYRGRNDVIVLALPRGGVPVAAEVARALDAPLDVLIVRKIGAPGQPELALGAVGEGGSLILHRETIAAVGASDAALAQIAAAERRELDRRVRLYRGGRPLRPVADRVAILVDDGLATGSTMEAAIGALRALNPARVVVAVPVGSREACLRVERMADEVVCPLVPGSFGSVGEWYGDFSQTTDEEVRSLLSAR